MGFRETLWFKKGILDADAASKAAADPELLDKADLLPIEDRYEGTVSNGDSVAFGVHTGKTEWIQLVEEVPGELHAGVLVREMKRGRRLYLAVLAGGVLLGAAILLMV